MSLHSNRSSRLLQIVLLSACFCIAALPAFALTGFIRVNQIGYEAGLSARAYLMTSSAVSSVSYAVKNSAGSTVASGSVGATLGTWGSFSVYPIDFTCQRRILTRFQ